MRKSVKNSMLFSATFLLSQTMMANAQTVHTVQHGDYLWKIANQYGITIQQLKDWNHLTSNYIYSGNQLVVSAPTGQATPAPAPISTPETAKPVVNQPVTQPSQPVNRQTTSGSGQVYTVQKGDYLYKIAQKFGVTVDQIKRWNNLSNNYIYTGNQLIVSEKQSAATPVTTPVIDKTETTVSPSNAKVHVAQKGDYLSEIARKYNLSMAQLREWNHMSDYDVKIGDRIYLTPNNPYNFSTPTRNQSAAIQNKTVGGHLSDQAKAALRNMNVTLLGDSIAVGITDLMQNQGFNRFNSDAKVGRRWEFASDPTMDGLYTINKLSDNGAINEYVVVILGTNFGARQDQIDRAMAKFGNQRKVLFVDTASEVEERYAVNRLYANNTQKYKNAYYVDWSNLGLRYFNEYFNPEYSSKRQRNIRLHPNNVGKKVLTEYISQALYQVKQRAASGSYTSPSTPTPSRNVKRYTVQKGDYLYKIAVQHGLTVDQLKRMNGLTSNYIYSGDQLIVAQ